MMTAIANNNLGYKQTSKLLPGVGLATTVKTTMNTIPTLPTVPCSSNILSEAIILQVFTSACWQMKHYIKCYMKFTIIHQDITHIPHANNLMIIRVHCQWILTYVIVILKCEQSRILMLTCVKQEENSSCGL